MEVRYVAPGFLITCQKLSNHLFSERKNRSAMFSDQCYCQVNISVILYRIFFLLCSEIIDICIIAAKAKDTTLEDYESAERSSWVAWSDGSYLHEEYNSFCVQT